MISPGLEVISLGQTVAKEGNGGLALLKNMKNGLNDFNIKARQGCAVFHSVYFHCSVQNHFNNALFCLD